MGSVKDLVVDIRPTEKSLGTGHFNFSDRYSVFDWGEMPDHISDKGKALCMMGAFNFENFTKRGIDSHYTGLIENDRVKNLKHLEDPSNLMFIQLGRKPELKFQSGEYKYENLKESNNYLIPLEVIFRNSIPVGSSIRRRYSPDELGFEFDEWPEGKIELETPIVEFSTKLEEKDRYIDEAEAREISGLKRKKFEELKDKTEETNKLLNQRAKKAGLSHEDGKVEFVYSNGRIILADVTGTFDENRFMYNEKQISKEFIRQWYKKNQPEWYEKVKKAKEEANERGVKNWKSLCKIKPIKLDQEVLETAENIYKAGANRWIGKKLFEAPHLEKVVGKI